MSKYNSIKRIREKRDEIREKIKTLDLSNFKDQSFGNENEYTYRGLIGGVESLLTDISTLTQYENKFIKLSTYEERDKIHNYLSSILGYLQSPQYLYQYIDNLKVFLRNYNIRNFSESLIVFENEIDNVRKIKIELQELLSESTNIKNDIFLKNEEILTLLEDSDRNYKKVQEEFQRITDEFTVIEEKSNSIKNLNDELESIKEIADENESKIVELTTTAESNSKLIDSFANRVQERENKLQEVEAKIETNNGKLQEYEAEREKILKEAKQLIEQAKDALKYNTTLSLSTSFANQYEKSKSGWATLPWLIIGFLFVLASLGIGVWIFFFNKEMNSTIQIVSRLSMLPITIGVAVFCANQYTKQKTIIEDYAYKMVLTRSIVGFSEQLKKNGRDDSEYNSYIQKVLGEIHQDPLRNRKSKYDAKDESYSLEKIIELLQKAKEITK